MSKADEVLTEITSLLKSNKIKITPQRLLIAEALIKLGHPTISEIYRYAAERSPLIGLATVYRTIHLFKKFGLIGELTKMRGRTRFEVRNSLHMNVECIFCGNITDIHSPLLKRALSSLKREGVKVIDCEVLIKSVCDNCHKKIKIARSLKSVI
ncbi:MAG: transcriptional repressor [Aigarchaeota archaeon]|nr:transcriptional repressor [Aigarchaeota archaeon]MDW8092960.1 Fur family transcriptional regulator [Nitrososphaerota archaeon]